MYQDILRGGVNMLDMDAFFISIKAAWLPKILYECDTWSCIAQMHVLSIADTTSITNFHVEKENCLDKINALPTFYKDVISSYAKQINTLSQLPNSRSLNYHCGEINI